MERIKRRINIIRGTIRKLENKKKQEQGVEIEQEEKEEGGEEQKEGRTEQ